MRRWICFVPALAAAMLAAPGHSADVLASLYHGQTAQEAGLVLGGWGSGGSRETKDEVLSGVRSIEVAADGYYSGARLDFAQPLDMSRYAGMSGVSLRFSIKFGKSTGATETGETLTPGGGSFQPGPGGPPMPGMPGMPGQPRGYVPGIPEDATPVVATHTLRIVLFSGKTRLATVDQPVDPEAASNGWIRVLVPLAAFHGNGGAAPVWAGFKMNRMLLFGDALDTFYVGDISVVQTDLSITDVTIGEEQEISAGDTAEFAASASGGAGLKYSWDFDSADGIQTDAVGRKVTFRYRKAGNYVVTLTVSDPTGVMKPVTRTTAVKVNE